MYAVAITKTNGSIKKRKENLTMNKHITRFLLFFSISLVLAFGILARPSSTFAHYSQHLLANQTDLVGSVAPFHPTIKLSQTSGPPTTQVIVRGTGFGVNENVSITLDSTPIGSTKTSRTRTFSTGITIPRYVSPGNFVVEATGKTSGRSAQALFLVQTNWNMFGDNARHSHFNPYENSIAPGNAVKLSNGWLFHTGSVIGSSPAVVNGVVYVGSNDGNVYAIERTTGAKVWSYSIGVGIVETSPAVVNGVVYVGQSIDAMSANLYALNAKTGAKLWSYTTRGGIGSSPTVVDGIVYFGSGDGNVYALNAKTGAKLWSYTTGNAIISSPAVAHGVVYIGSGDGNVYAFNAKTGAKVWSSNIGSFIESSPTVANGLVYIGAQDDSLSLLDAATGAKLWSATTGSPLSLQGISSSPTVVNGAVYIGSRDGNLYTFCICG